MNGYWTSGFIVFTAVIIVSNLKIAFISFNLGILTILSIIASIAAYFGIVLLMNFMFDPPLVLDNVYYG